VTPYIEAEFPDKTVFIHTSTGQYNDHKIGIWGEDIPYGERVEIGFNSDIGRTWQEALFHQLDITDMSDQIERERDESNLDFFALESQVKDLQEAIEKLRDQASDRVKQLPIPISAKIRKSGCHWSQPSTALCIKYPNLFGER
jgi:hypothetical protein